MFRIPAVLLWVALLAVASPAGAGPDEPGPRASGALDRGEPRVEAELLVHDAGGLQAGVRLEVDPGWHIYAPDPGQTGLPTRIELSAAPPGGVGELVWPPHRTYRDAGLEAYGYEGTVLVRAPLHGRPGELRASVELLACREKCIPATLELRSDGHASAAPETAALFSSFGAGPEPPAGPGPAAGPGLLRALVFALLGGIILNAMPCVLPVLAIKVFGIAEIARRSRAEVAAHGLAYAGGVLVTLWLLAAVVLLLRAAGTSVGWGFHFQEPVFVAVICAVVVGFALNLLGVYEITPPAGRLAGVAQSASGLRRSFFEGLLAVVLATPCTAPFLGTAVGFAFAGSAALVLGIFSAIGVGLALPYVLISLVPALARLMPRPGAWMVKLRTTLGFALLGSAVWLLWILGRSAGLDAMTAVLGALVAIGFGAWLIGSVQRAESGRGALAAGAVAVAAGLVSLGLVDVRPASDPVADGWQVFDAQAVRSSVDSGQPAFVYFTADWCLTCKLNERQVLADPRVAAELERVGAERFRADWTRRDPAIRAELARHGRAGVPLYLVYAPGAEQPRVLPELLSVDLLVEALRETRGAPR